MEASTRRGAPPPLGGGSAAPTFGSQQPTAAAAGGAPPSMASALPASSGALGAAAGQLPGTQGTLRERIVRFYKQNAPNRLHEVDELLATARFDEGTLMAALLARYGKDHNADMYRPQQLRSSVVDYEYYENGKRVGADTSLAAASLSGQQEGNEGEDNATPSGKRAPQIEGGALLTQLMLFHLNQTGLESVAESFRGELSVCGYPFNYYDPEESPVDLQRMTITSSYLRSQIEKLESDRPSPLTQLLCPASRTRFMVQELMHDNAKHIRAEIGSLRQESIAVDYLVRMAATPLWTEPAALSKTEYVHQATKMFLAASLNQIVEHMTNVTYQPHVSIPKSKQEADQRFCNAVFHTHTHFTTSNVLLAKLIQRFFVPCTLPLGDRFDTHGIMISNVGGEPPSVEGTDAKKYSGRSRYFLLVSKLVQIKVLAVLALWLKEVPQQFTPLMLASVRTLVEENCYVPALWSDAPIELMQAAEAIKMLMQKIEMSDTDDGGRGAGGAGAGMGEARKSSTHSGNNVNFLFARHKTSTKFELQNPGASVMSVGTSDAARFSAEGDTEERMEELLGVDELRLANQITTVDHHLFRKIDTAELFVFATQNGVMRLHMTNHPALHLNAYLHRAEDISAWVVTEILLFGKFAVDRAEFQKSTGGRQAAAASGPDGIRADFTHMHKLVQKLISLAFRLLEINNIHSAFAIICGLRHPCIARLHRSLWLALPPSAQQGFAEIKKFFDFGKGYQPYKEFLDGIPDNDVYPLLPLVAITVDELRRLESSQPTVVKDLNNRGLVHWRKFNVMFTMYDRMQQWQRAPIPAEFEEIEECTEWFQGRLVSALHDTEKTLALSLKIEPAPNAQ